MQRSDLYEYGDPPTFKEISEFVNNELWDDFNIFLQNTYHVLPKITYSKCPMQKGWNIKYQKSGKSLCVLYPMAGLFTALVVVGEKEISDAESLLPSFSEYTKNLIQNTRFSAGGKWLMIKVDGKPVLEDVINLISIRVKPRIEKQIYKESIFK